MKKNITKVLSYVSVVFLFISIIILVCVFSKQNKLYDTKSKDKRISISKIVISDRDKESYSSTDIVVSDELIDTYKEIINSKNIKRQVQEVYPDVNDIELSVFSDTSILIVTYICDGYTNEECIDINKKYVSLFIDVIDSLYDVKASFIESPFISTRK